MSGEVTPAATPATHVKVDPLNPSVVIPVYLGGEGPVPTPPAGDRGDTVAPATPVAATPAAPTEPVATPAATGAVAPAATELAAGATVEPAAVAASPEAPAATPAAEVTPPAEPTAPVRNEKGQFIPRARFNEVNEERKALKEENDRLKAEKGATAAVTEGTYDFDAKEKEYADLLLDGKTAEAIALRKEIRTAERAEYAKEVEQTTVKTTERMTVESRINEISESVATALPQFDPESDSYNGELLEDVRDFYRGALESGRYADPADAFQASIDKAIKLHGLAMPTPAAATPAAPAAAAPAAPAAAVAPARTAEKRVQAIVNQPPSLAGVGSTGAPEVASTIDVKALTDAQLAALPAATRARLRGDIL